MAVVGHRFSDSELNIAFLIIFCDVFAVFSNIIKKSYIQILADSDEHDLVQQVQVRN